MTSRAGINTNVLMEAIEKATTVVQDKIDGFTQSEDSMSIAEMFDLQMLMNELSQISEASTSVVSAMNQSIKTMATNAGR